MAATLLAGVAMLAWVNPAAVAQGETGFLRGEGKLDVAVGYNLDRYDHFWMGSNKVSNDAPGFGRVDRTSYNLYAAYGLTDDIDLVLQGAYTIASAENGFPREADLQDGQFRLKWKAVEQEVGPGKASLLLAPGIKAPLDNYEDNSITAIGDGQTDYLARLVLHYSFDNGIYAAIESGYDFRAGRPKDEVPFSVSVGYTWKDLTISPFYSQVNSLGGPDLGSGAPFSSVEEDYSRLGVGLYYRITDGVGVSGSVRTTLDGRNTGDVDGFTLGMVFRF